ncbi:protein containing Phenylalanyl-tRNA synthetase, class II [human gut metagenome]|uniref:Protein containing Phenylalanyl-tRNA synthetase, class II n=1 Tax=human gut metagenome TaxID=408170 RepID=K1UX05_9ZZZZ
MRIEEVKQLLEKDKETVTDLNSLNELKVKYLGKKGMITELNQEIKNIPNEEKKNLDKK